MFIIVLLMSLWWFGWSGTLFLSSTRVIFAAAIDRMLPEWVSKIEPRTKTPINALLLMVIPSAIISYLYAFKVFNFQTLALDATVVIAITFLGSTIAGIVMPWRAKDVFDGSPIAKYKVPAWLGWIVTVVLAVFAVYLIYTFVQICLDDHERVGSAGCEWSHLVRGDRAGAAHHFQCGDPGVDLCIRWSRGSPAARPCRSSPWQA